MITASVLEGLRKLSIQAIMVRQILICGVCKRLWKRSLAYAIALEWEYAIILVFCNLAIASKIFCTIIKQK